MKRQYNKGRFLVTESEGLRDVVAPEKLGSVPKVGKKDSSKAVKAAKAACASISEKTEKAGRVVKKGRFKVFTCCHSAVKDFEDDADRELLDDRVPWPPTDDVKTSEDLDIGASGIPAVCDDTVPSPANFGSTPASDQGPQHSMEAFSDSSWDSASSISSYHFDSRVSSGIVRVGEAALACAAHCSSPAINPASPSGSPASTSISQSFGSHLSSPRSMNEFTLGPVVRSYKRGRFAVEEALLRAPVIHVARTISCPGMGSSSCGREARLGHSEIPLAARSRCPTAAPLTGAADPGARHMPEHTWGLDEDGDGISELPPCRRHTTVSYFRRGRFLVQTVV